MKHNLWNLVANIKNGYVAKKLEIEVRRNKSCENLLNLLWNEGYISGFKIKTNDSYMINVFLKYNSEGTPALKSIKSVSKPSKRIFLTTKQLWKIDSSRTNAVFLILVQYSRQV